MYFDDDTLTEGGGSDKEGKERGRKEKTGEKRERKARKEEVGSVEGRLRSGGQIFIIPIFSCSFYAVYADIVK